jgi:hypothetical protein
MSKQAGDPLSEVAALVHACVAKEAWQVSGTAGQAPKARAARRRRLALAGGIAAVVALAFFSGLRGEGREKNPADPDAVRVKDVDGRVQTPLFQPDKKATVLFFLLPDCPISNAYAPEIKRICADYAPKKIAAFVVHADPDVTAEQAKKHARDYGFGCPVVLDPAHVLVKKTGVTMAPEVAVVGPDRKVLYRGRIDDWYADYGKRRAEPTQRDLRNALDAVLQEKAVARPTTKVIGCYLPDPKQ